MNDWPIGKPDVSLLLVEHFFNTEIDNSLWDGDNVGLHRYLVSFIGMSTNKLCETIADTISDVAALGISMNEMQGFIFLNSIIHEAVHEECGIGFMPLMPWQERPDEFPWLLMHSPPEGGVEIGFGSDEPWDPTMWQLRYSERWAS